MRILFLLWTVAIFGAPKAVKLETVPATAELTGARAGQQFLAIATFADGTQSDVTADVQWTAKGAVMKGTRVTALADGVATVEAVWEGLRARSVVKVRDSGVARPFAFSRDIGSVLTKRGCNSSACHGGVKGRGGHSAYRPASIAQVKEASASYSAA